MSNNPGATISCSTASGKDESNSPPMIDGAEVISQIQSTQEQAEDQQQPEPHEEPGACWGWGPMRDSIQKGLCALVGYAVFGGTFPMDPLFTTNHPLLQHLFTIPKISMPIESICQ